MKFTYMTQKKNDFFYRWFISKSNRCGFVHNGVVVIEAIALSLMLGCTTYNPMPITQDAVHNSLQPPDMTQMRALACNIKHPILHPVELKADEGLLPYGVAVLEQFPRVTIGVTINRDTDNIRTTEFGVTCQQPFEQSARGDAS